MSKKGMCDYRCWYAAGKVCRCFCSGENHGRGRESKDDPVFVDMMRNPDYAKYGFNEAQYNTHRAIMIKEGRLNGESESAAV